MTDKKGGCKNCGKPKRDHMKANRGDIYYCHGGGMWQNAAESLPARDTPICPMCRNLSRTCPICTALEVEPVELDLSLDAPMMDYEEAGKEAYAEQRVIVFRAIPTGQKFAAHPEGHYVALTKPSRTVAEPKPTPSTSKCVNCAETVRFGQECEKGGYCYAAPSANLVELLRHKPQPDSSSIPCVGCEGHPVAPNDPCAVCDSSSISTEQSFEEAWKATYPSMCDMTFAMNRAFKEVGEKLWAAAKGQR